MWDLKCSHTSDVKLTVCLQYPQTWFSITTFAPLLDLSKYVVIVRHSRQGGQEGPESSSSLWRPGWSSDHSRGKASVYTGRVWNDKLRKGDRITCKVRREKKKLNFLWDSDSASHIWTRPQPSGGNERSLQKGEAEAGEVREEESKGERKLSPSFAEPLCADSWPWKTMKYSSQHFGLALVFLEARFVLLVLIEAELITVPANTAVGLDICVTRHLRNHF